MIWTDIASALEGLKISFYLQVYLCFKNDFNEKSKPLMPGDLKKHCRPVGNLLSKLSQNF